MASCKQKHHLTLKKVKADSSFSKTGHDILELLPVTTTKLGLSQITNGVDSFEFRFWLPEKSLDTINVLSIKYTSNNWESTLTRFVAILPDYEYRKGDTTNYLRQAIIKFIPSVSVKPNINISLIVDTLAMFDLQNAPSNAKIEEGQEISSGSSRYTLEFADKDSYRAVYYTRAQRNSGLIVFDDTFEKFIKFIKRHYKINIYYFGLDELYN